MSHTSAGRWATIELADRVLRAGNSLKASVGAGVGRDEATRILRAWLEQLELEVDTGGLLAMLRQADFAVDADQSAQTQSAPTSSQSSTVRVAVVADDLGAGHGLADTLAQLRERTIPGHRIDLLGADAQAVSQGSYDLVHACTPGPAGVAALLLAAGRGIPVLGSYHTDLSSYPTELQSGLTGDRPLDTVLAGFYGRCRLVLSPSRWADQALLRLGIPDDRIARWEFGVDRTRFTPACYASDILPDAINVLYVGRLSREKGTDLLADAFQIAHDREPRLHLVLAGAGPEEQRLRARLRSTASFLGWLAPEQLARAYASADLLVFPSAVDTFGRVVLEAQASGLPVLAVDGGGAAELIESGRSGCLVPADPHALAGAIRGLARRAALQDRLATGGLLAVARRSWERSLQQLASGYARALGRVGPEGVSGSESSPEVARAA